MEGKKRRRKVRDEEENSFKNDQLKDGDKMGKGVEELEKEQANSDGEQGEEGDEEEDDENDGEENRIDGMADMMSKILHQQVGNKIPVLAKRKTTIMKELELEYADRDRLKKLKLAKKESRDKHLVLPQVLSADYERQLRKIATRGVVALFNAIAKSKRTEQEAIESATTSSSKDTSQLKAKDVIEMSRSNFLDLLKGNGGEGAGLGSSSTSIGTKKTKSLSKKQDPDRDDDGHDDEDDDGLGVASWSVLKESYLTDKKLALKDWDKEDDDEEEEEGGDGEGSDHSGHGEDLEENSVEKSSKKQNNNSMKRNLKQKGNKSKKQKTGGHKRR